VLGQMPRLQATIREQSRQCKDGVELLRAALAFILPDGSPYV
jgi:hypothetical protein